MSTYCKYYKQQKQVSYDSGQTWSNVVPAEYQMGSLYEMDSMDCTHGSAIIRWILVPGDYLCEGKDKYEKEIEQYSTDNGVTWMNVYPTTYRKGKLIESNSSICDNKWEGHYTDDSSDTGPCPKNYKWVEGVGCVPIDPVKIIRCSSSPSSTLTQSDVRYNPYVLFEGIIGECVTSIGDRTFQDCTGITSIVIPSGVTSIGNWSFKACTGLTSIDIPTGVTSIGVSAFERCSGLTSINIPSGVTNIGSEAFSGCTGFTSITVRATTPPTLGNRAFNNTNNCPIYVPCESVNTYKYTPAWKTYETRIQGIPPCETPPPALLKLYASYSGGTTYGILCDSSTTLTQSEVKATSHSESYSAMTDAIVGNCVTSLGDYAFSGCTSLTGITIPSGLTSIGTQAFYRCGSLTSIDIPTSVTTIGSSAFSMCDNITTIDIPDGVRTIGERTFSGCSSLSSCTIGSGVTSIGDFAFWYCGLTNIDIPDSVTSIGKYAFNGCGSLTSVTIGSGVTGIGERGFDSCSNLTSITVKATTPPTLAYYVFDNTNNCPIYVPCESVNTYKSASMWSKYSSRIYSINCPHKFDATYTGGTSYYKYCDGSTTLTSGDTSPRGSYPHSGMTTVAVGNCVTIIGDGAFYNCYKLSSATLSDSVTSIGLRAFRDCRILESIDIPTGVTSISGSAFYYCTSLTSITIPDSVTSIGYGAFYGCSSLTSCTIGSGVTSIGGSVFYQCGSLTSITIPDSVTNIGDEAFYGCSSLTSCTIGSGVTSIGYSAFYGCSSLTSITINATTPPTIYYDTFNTSNNCLIYVPCESVSTYKSASGWSTYADRIHGIPPCGDYRWVDLDPSTDYYCSGTTKYYKQQKQLSYDSGQTWSNVVPAEYQQGDVVQEQSVDCGYVPTEFKLKAAYAGGNPYYIECESTLTELSSGETKGYSTPYSSMTSAVVGECVTSIGDRTFSNCTSLTSVTISDSVTSIGYQAFSTCRSLTSVTIPDSVTSIGNYAFSDCSNLTSITINAITPPALWGSWTFYNTNNCPIYVPAGSVDAYKAGYYWSAYADRIQAIP